MNLVIDYADYLVHRFYADRIENTVTYVTLWAVLFHLIYHSHS